MTQETETPTRAEMIARIQKQRDEIEQYLWDVEHWNNSHPTEKIDGDPDGQMQKMLTALDDCLKREARMANIQVSHQGHSPQVGSSNS